LIELQLESERPYGGQHDYEERSTKIISRYDFRSDLRINLFILKLNNNNITNAYDEQLRTTTNNNEQQRTTTYNNNSNNSTLYLH
jgi:hypothetical protein